MTHFETLLLNNKKGQIYSQVWDQVDKQVWGQVPRQVRRQVDGQVEYQVWHQVRLKSVRIYDDTP